LEEESGEWGVGSRESGENLIEFCVPKGFKLVAAMANAILLIK
jgi:hypothetical protein